MAAAVALTPVSPALLPSLRGRRHGRVRLSAGRPRRAAAGRCLATAQTFQGGPAASYAREMERLSAKESLLLAITLSGRRSPTTVAHFKGLDVLIKDGYTKISSDLKFLNTIQSKFLLTTQLSVEGPIRMKEEYVEGLIEVPKISEETIPEQLKGLIGQAAGALQQLPSPIRDAAAEGLKLPLSGTFQRLFMISYLDEEILIIRDAAGAPDVLTRLEGPQPTPGDGTADAVMSEYES
ncbi:hypothetical protein PR202_ga18680 [Eleusine coracana subsp. coracana]|uniref:Plastid lipid-associated protein/fibrillin conserved domain-containing protein n=1 Tax=Eleusine coracana subsp. coracana TaxID=191504 RepID=A0AAV5CTK3_ELECO|nr:hypothetical protein PR202_ga18680 [Eleusine coracana subsp. coracana]